MAFNRLDLYFSFVNYHKINVMKNLLIVPYIYFAKNPLFPSFILCSHLIEFDNGKQSLHSMSFYIIKLSHIVYNTNIADSRGGQ